MGKVSLQALLVLMLAVLPWSAQAEPDSDQQAQVWKMLEDSTWVAEGAENPERVVYMFTDMNCPYCARQWQAMQPYLESKDNVVQVRHILVALLRPSSLPKGAAVLASDNPVATFQDAERHYDDSGLKPLDKIPAKIENQIQGNTILMMRLGLNGTPATLFHDPNGRLQAAPGVISDEALGAYVFQTK